MDILLLFILLFPTITTTASYFVGKKNEFLRNLINILSTLINLIVVIYLFKYIKTESITYQISYVMGTGLYLKLDAFRYVFVLLTSFIWFIVNIYSSQYLFGYIHRNRYHFFFMVTYISTLGIFISENILNLFTFFEIMSFSSYPLIIHDEDDEAHEAGVTYMAMAVAGGMILLMGIFILYSYTQILNITQLSYVLPDLGYIKYVISGLLIIGFGIKAGLVPLHMWLPKAHPAAPTPASAILSGILVKTGIFGILITVIFLMNYDMYLSYLMVVFGFTNIFTGGILALYPVNIKKTLAYSTMSQIGYLFLGIGLIGLLKDHGYLAVYGTMFHIFNHGVFKVMLFMGVGIIYMITHELDINKLYGFGRFKPILKITFFIGFCAIIGMPGFNGYLSKTLIHHSLSEFLHGFSNYIRISIEILFTVGSSITTAYLLKLYISLFVEDNSKYYASYRRYINKRALFPMVISSFIIIYVGLTPNVFEKYFFNIYSIFNIDPTSIHSIQFYSLGNMSSSFITIGLGIFIYLKYILPKLRKENKNSGHLDYFNKSENWISLEKNLYIPVLRFLFLTSTYILRIIDNLLIKTAAYI
ncbi:MAG: proton-conducting transporter membrane subunit, partial [Bacillota bacterium]|nr:proton-conducting transporter membrane subunit [Bacillota bacterium]